MGTVDIVAVAPGKIIPSGRTKTIQPFETGVVRAIHVRDGQTVSAGDVLIELDPTMSGAELGRLKSDLMAAQLDAARLRAALAGKNDPLTAFAPPDGAPSDLIQMHRRFLLSQTAEQNAKIAAIDRQVAQKRAERATIEASIEKLEAIIPPLQERVEIRRHLFDKELGSKLVYLTELQDLIGQKREIGLQESRYGEADAAITALVETPQWRSTSVACLTSLPKPSTRHPRCGSKGSRFRLSLARRNADLIPSPTDQNPWAHWRSPMDMMRQG